MLSRDQYDQAIRYLAGCDFVPRESIELVANLWGTPIAVVEADLAKEKRPTYPQFVGRLTRPPKETPHA
jgi:hypothetical protein